MTFHASLSLVAFSVFVTRPTLSLFVSPSNICFSLLHFPSTIFSSHEMFLFLFSSHGHKRLLGVYVVCLRVILLCRLLIKLFCLISLQCIRFVAFTKEPHFCCLQFLFFFLFCALTKINHIELWVVRGVIFIVVTRVWEEQLNVW